MGKLNLILKIAMVVMYPILGVIICFHPNYTHMSVNLKVGICTILVAYSGYRIYRLVQRQKAETKNQELHE